MTKKTTNKYLSMTAILATLAGFSSLALAHDDDKTMDKLKDKAGDVKTDAKRANRKMKRKVRKARGDDNVLKDARDELNDAGDNISNEADKAKRKLQ